jgi:hypothetical protein
VGVTTERAEIEACAVLMSQFIESIEDDLTALGEIGGPEVAATVNRVVAAIRPALRSRLLEGLNALVQDLDDRSATKLILTLDGDELHLERRETEEPSPPPLTNDFNARIALRVPDELKRAFERSARSGGISVNSWIVRTLDRALRTEVGPWAGPKHMRGTGQA